MYPVLFEIFGFPISTFGVMLAMGPGFSFELLLLSW